MRRRRAEVHFCRRCPAETLMGAKVSVVKEAQLDLLHQVFRDEWPKQAQTEGVLQRPPQPFDQCYRSLLLDRPEPLLHPEPPELAAKDLALEAARLIRDEVRRPPALPRSPRNEPGHFGRGRLLGKHPGRERHPRERIENGSDLERHDSEQSFHVGKIHHPDVIRALCPHGSRDSRCSLRRSGHQDPGGLAARQNLFATESEAPKGVTDSTARAARSARAARATRSDTARRTDGLTAAWRARLS